MIASFTYKFIVAVLIPFSFTACDWFSFQDTVRNPLGGLYELIEIIDSSGNIISKNNDNEIPLFVYRKWFGMSETIPQQPIDSLYYLKTPEGELVNK